MHLDVVCIHKVVLCWSSFEKWVGFEKDERHNRLFNFYNWLFICILYQWSFFILEIKEKSLYMEKNCLASQCGLISTRSWVRPLWWCQSIFLSALVFCFPLFFSLKIAWLLVSLHVSFCFSGVGSSKSW